MCACVSSSIPHYCQSACWPADPAVLRLEADTFLCPPPGEIEGGGVCCCGCCAHLISEEEEGEEEEAAGQCTAPLQAAPGSVWAAKTVRTEALLAGSLNQRRKLYASNWDSGASWRGFNADWWMFVKFVSGFFIFWAWVWSFGTNNKLIEIVPPSWKLSLNRSLLCVFSARPANWVMIALEMSLHHPGGAEGK